MAKIKPYAFSFLGGILYALGFPSALGKSLLITPILGMLLLLFFLLSEKGFKKKAGLILAFNLSFNLVGFYWIAQTLMEFGELPAVAAWGMSLLFTFIITPHLWVALPLIHFGLQRTRVGKTWELYPPLFSVILAFLLTLLEYFTPQQFPAMIGQPWAAVGRHLGFANIGGIPIYSFFSFLLIMEVIHTLKFKKFSRLNLAVVFIFIFSNPLVDFSSSEQDPKNLNIRMVQANISNFLKMESEEGGYASVNEVLERYQDLSLRPYPFGEADLLIWPETAYPFAIESNKSDFARSEVPAVFRKIALLQSSALFIGGYDINGESEGYYQSEFNSNFHINQEGKLENVYHKHILIPFGETLPFGPFNEKLSRYINNISFFSEGTRFPMFEIHTGHQFINTICYEILKPEFVRTYLNQQKKRPHALVNLTNDSWYGDTAEPEQHLFLASWRALELDLPIIRSTNTGISSFINTDGEEVKRLGVGVTGNLDLSVQLGRRSATIYQIFGFFALVPICFALFIFHLILLKLKR